MKGNPFYYIIPLACLGLATAEFFSSTHEVNKLAGHEQFLVHKMEKFVALNEDKLDFLKEKLQEMETEREEADANSEFFEDPINRYLLTKRLSTDWERLVNFLEYEAGINIVKGIYRYKKNNTWPSEHDFNGAVEGMLRLHRIYRLSAKDMAQGILGGVKYSAELSSGDCYDIGMHAMNGGYLPAAHAWLTEALERFDRYKPGVFNPKLEKPDIIEALAEVKFKLSDFNGAAALAYSLTLWRPDDLKARELYAHCLEHAYTKPSYNVEMEHEPIPDDLDSVNPSRGYELTCSGHIHPLSIHERDSRCRYLTKNHPFLKLAPLKVEELHPDPQVLLFHDVIYDSEIQKIINLAEDQMERAGVVAPNGSTISPQRTCKVAFFPTQVEKVFEIIDERVADMTGLNMDSAEQHQVANYGIGGHYAQHNDFFYELDEVVLKRNLEEGQVEKKLLGNRIATVLFYLTDVEQGGGTAFQYIKRQVKPKKGTAVFWYNLHASGDGDTWTEHGACPVLVGSKWVLNRWIRERGQEFKRPCELTNDAMYNSYMF